jgi:sterol desaturase/sphingolipid hydroxylase (fatty acid hydroxylase superfamily)
MAESSMDGVSNVSRSWPSPVGLSLGLLAVALVQIFVTIPYYYCLRTGIWKRPLIQKQSKDSQKSKPFWEGLKEHLSQPEGFILLGGYLSGTWMFNLMPASYYSFDGGVSAIHVVAQLLIVDFFQTVMHKVEHKISSIYVGSHKPHHVFKAPVLFDAFNGSFNDTVFMILVPLYITANIVHCNVWSYMAFGAIYGNYLCLIHSEYSHAWDPFFRMVGIGTAGDHHVHHKLFRYNYGHLFMYWDRLFGTYRSPVEMKEHFNHDLI